MALRCERCHGLTTWRRLCGICRAVLTGVMTDMQVGYALEALERSTIGKTKGIPKTKRTPRRSDHRFTPKPTSR